MMAVAVVVYAEGIWCDGGSYGCVPHKGTGVMGVSVFVC